jgi:hypothetical protein
MAGKGGLTHTKLTDVMVREIIYRISGGKSVVKTCAELGMSTMCFYRWLVWGRQGKAPRYAEFYRLYREAEAQALLNHVLKYQSYEEGYFEDALLYVASVYPDAENIRSMMPPDLTAMRDRVQEALDHMAARDTGI